MSQPAGNSETKLRGATACSSATVFTSGLPMFLRFKLGGLDRIIPVLCQGVIQPSNLLIAQWTEDSAQISGYPGDAQEVQCQVLTGGVLFLVKGRTTSASSGRLPRVRIQISDKCLGVKLRTQQRFAVRGKLEVLEAGGAVYYAHNHPQKMNISLGGFGTRVPEGLINMLKQMNFRIEAFIEREGKADDGYPALVFEGQAELRHAAPSSQEGMLYAGFSFSKLNDTNLGMLQFWIATNDQILHEL